MSWKLFDSLRKWLKPEPVAEPPVETPPEPQVPAEIQPATASWLQMDAPSEDIPF